MSTLSENLNRINEAVNTIRSKTSTEGQVIEDVVAAVGKNTGAYKVSSIEERDALTASEGDVCLVQNRTEKPDNGIDSFVTFKIPYSVTLPRQVTEDERISGSYYPEDGSRPRPSNVGIRRTSATLEFAYFPSDGEEWGEELRVEFTSTDGIHYTRSGGWGFHERDGEDIIRVSDAKPLKYDPTGSEPISPFDERIGCFMVIPINDFKGIYSYKDNAWDYLDIGINTSSKNILKNTKAYSNSGVLTGTLLDEYTDESALSVYTFTDNIIDYMNTVTNFQTPQEGKGSYGKFQGNASKHLSFMKYLTNNNITNWCNAFGDNPNLEDIEIPNITTDKTEAFAYMFMGCAKLKHIDLRNFTSTGIKSGITSYYKGIAYMFGGCIALKHLDMRSFDFTNPVLNETNYINGAFTSIPADCLIIVKDNNQKNWFASKVSRLTNVKTVAEYEG